MVESSNPSFRTRLGWGTGDFIPLVFLCCREGPLIVLLEGFTHRHVLQELEEHDEQLLEAEVVRLLPPPIPKEEMHLCVFLFPQ